MSEVTRIDSLVMYTPGSKSTWNNFTDPIPNGLYVYDDVQGVIKIGNGTNIFSELPIFLNLAEINAGVNIDLSRLGPIEAGDIDKIMVVDSAGKYVVGAITLTELQDAIAAITSKNSDQDIALGEIQGKANSIATIGAGQSGSIVTVNSQNKMAPIGVTLNANKTSVINAVKWAFGLKILDVKFYIDQACTIEVAKLNENLTYYAKIFATDANSIPIAYSLTVDGNPDIVISTTAVSSVLRITVPQIQQNQVVEFTATVTNGYREKTLFKSVSLFGYIAEFNRNNGSNAVTYNKIKIDGNGNYIGVGKISISGVGLPRAIITKFDPNMIVLVEKSYNIDGADEFTDVVVDSEGNYIAVGHSLSEKFDGYSDGIIYKFNSDLNVIRKIRYTSDKNIVFNSVIADGNKNYITVGYTNSVGSVGKSIVVVKTNRNLNVIYHRIIDDGNDSEAVSIKLDNTNRYIILGKSTGGAFDSGVIIKMDSVLNVLLQKTFITTVDLYPKSLAVDINNNYIVVGYGESTNKEGFIIKFNSILEITDSQIFYGNLDEVLTDIAIDKNNKYIVIGTTNTESGDTVIESFILKLESNFATISKKKLTSINNILLNGVSVDANNNYIVTGVFGIFGFACKLNPNMVSGTFTDVVSGITFTDCFLLFNYVSLTTNTGLGVSSIPAYSVFESQLNENTIVDTRVIGTIG